MSLMRIPHRVQLSPVIDIPEIIILASIINFRLVFPAIFHVIGMIIQLYCYLVRQQCWRKVRDMIFDHDA